MGLDGAVDESVGDLALVEAAVGVLEVVAVVVVGGVPVPVALVRLRIVVVSRRSRGLRASVEILAGASVVRDVEVLNARRPLPLSVPHRELVSVVL